MKRQATGHRRTPAGSRDERFTSGRLGLLAAAAVASITALAISACGSGGNGGTGATSPPTSSSGRPATIGVANNGALGKILDDSQRRTVYLFQKDVGTKSSCTGGCAAAWPPVRTAGKPVIGSGLAASKIGTTARSDGKPQITYNGHPLYLYSGDEKPGDTNGQGLTAFGAAWFALSPAGDMVAGTGSNKSGNFGY
jgi:predicted lipoprotein with Yx(FWY)xxD motif